MVIPVPVRGLVFSSVLYRGQISACCDEESFVPAGPCVALSVLPVLPLTTEVGAALLFQGGVRHMYTAMREGRGGGVAPVGIEHQILPTRRKKGRTFALTNKGWGSFTTPQSVSSTAGTEEQAN